MEFLVGLLCFAVGGTWAVAAVRHGGRLRSASLWAALVLELGIIGTLGLDWGYSWVQETALHMVLDKNVWLATPHALALLCLLGMVRWGRFFAPWAAVLSALQSAVFIPVLLSVERNTSMSFLALAPIAAMFAAVLAGFLFLPTACEVLPDPGSRWHRIAFGPRERLISAIASLGNLGLTVSAPGSVFESGTAVGRLGAVDVEVTSAPTLLPPAYGLRVRWQRVPGKDGPPPPAKPGFAPRENVRVRDGGLEYEGTSDAGFSVEPERLQSFVREGTV